MDKLLQLGDKIYCKNWHDLKRTAFRLSAEGYGVTCIGFAGISDNILTITAMPESKCPGDKCHECNRILSCDHYSDNVVGCDEFERSNDEYRPQGE